ncbi:MAG: GNAT family N-acetyltransferase [Terriglobales bacterium]
MGCDLQPTLTGELVILRPLRQEDFEPLHAAASDPLIWEQHPEPTRYQIEVFRKYFDSGIACEGAFAVVERARGRIIGSTRYHDYRPGPPSEIEIGYTFLQRAYWGGGYNGEMKRLLVAHALRSVDRVVFTAGGNNLRSRRALEKIGAKLAGESSRPTPDGSPNLLYEIRQCTVG